MMNYRDGKFEIRPSVLEDVCVLKETMSESDRKEVWAAMHHTPEQDLLVCYTSSEIRATVLLDGVVIAMFGAAPDGDGKAVAWLLGSDGVRKCGLKFARASKIAIAEMLKNYPRLYNYVDARYQVSMEWLRWCGAKIKPAQPYGPDRMLFHYFEFERVA